MNDLLIRVIKDAIQREHERIERAQAEIVKLKEELIDLGYEEPAEVERETSWPTSRRHTRKGSWYSPAR